MDRLSIPVTHSPQARAASHTDAQDAGLSVCLTCSSLFCDDESAAKHASAHHGTSRHPIAFSVRTQTCWYGPSLPEEERGE